LKTLSKSIVGIVLVSASPLAAAGTEAAMPVVSTLVSLVVVLAAIGVVAFLAKRFSPGNASQPRLMRVVNQLPLGPREKISIVELDDQWFVLGVTSQQITVLSQMPRKESAAAPSAINFATLFKRARSKHE